jgi:hypothetical protein
MPKGSHRNFRVDVDRQAIEDVEQAVGVLLLNPAAANRGNHGIVHFERPDKRNGGTHFNE